jgi:DNA-binding MarR family transcriptional regulator
VVATNSSVKSASELEGRLTDRRLREVYRRFIDREEIPYIVAAAAIVQAYKLTAQRAESVLAEFDLTMLRYEILGLLMGSEEGRMSLRDLKRATLLHPATMTYTIDSLHKRKLIRRLHDDGDRRTISAEITPSGRKLAERATDALREAHFGLTGLSEEDAVGIAILLSRMPSD